LKTCCVTPTDKKIENNNKIIHLGCI